MRINLNFLNTLTLIFIVLKLCGLVVWGWFWVLSPTLIPLSILCSIILLAMVGKKGK